MLQQGTEDDVSENDREDQGIVDRTKETLSGIDAEVRLPGEGINAAGSGDAVDSGGQTGTTVRDAAPTGEQFGTTVRDAVPTGEEHGTTVQEEAPSGEEHGTTVTAPSSDAPS